MSRRGTRRHRGAPRAESRAACRARVSRSRARPRWRDEKRARWIITCFPLSVPARDGSGDPRRSAVAPGCTASVRVSCMGRRQSPLDGEVHGAPQAPYGAYGPGPYGSVPPPPLKKKRPVLLGIVVAFCATMGSCVSWCRCRCGCEVYKAQTPEGKREFAAQEKKERGGARRVHRHARTRAQEHPRDASTARRPT